MENQEFDINETAQITSIVDGQPSLNTRNVVDFEKSLESQLAKFFSEAHSNLHFSLKIIRKLYKLFKHVIYNTMKEILQQTASNHSDLQQQESSILRSIDAICSKFNSYYFQRTYFIEKGTFIAPVNQNPNHRDTSGCSSTVATAQFIPMRKLLTNLFHVDGMMETIDTHLVNLTKRKETVNIIQSKSWKKLHPPEMRNGKCYPLVIYHNTLEITASKHRQIRKVGALYMWLPFLPHQIALQLDFPITVYEMNSTNVDSNEQIFTPVIKEINYLAAVGVNVNAPGYYHGRVRFKLVAIMGDSEELRSLLGFTRSFQVTYPCRMCREVAPDLEELLDESDLLLRNYGNYLYDVRLHDPMTTGIKEKSVWLKVRDFDLFENATEDFVEDFLQNICPIVMTVVVPALIKKEFFNLKCLNEAIEKFKYGPDASSKPPKFTEKGPFRFRMSSNQCLTFMRYFSLMVGPNVNKDDEHWELYLLARGLMLDLMKEEFDSDSVDDLKNGIRWFNNSFLKESEEAYLRPSFHRLVHYPWLIENLGPLKPLWEVRHKSKQTMYQIVENSSTKIGNSCRVIANRHQWLLNSFFYNNLVPPMRICAEMERVWKVNQLKLRRALDLSNKVGFKQVKWVTYCGITYREGYVICYNEFDLYEELDSAQFGLIRDIYVDPNSDSVFFICWTVKTSEYDYHTCTFEVEWEYPHFYGADAITFLSLDRVKHRRPSIFFTYSGGDFFYSDSMYVISRNSW